MQARGDRGAGWSSLLGRRVLAWVIVVAMLSGAAVGLQWLGRVPETQAQVEDHLERSILTYAVVDGVPFIVFRLDGRVYLDRLILDWISIEWPPTPRWQWSGGWDYIPATTEPASVGYGSTAVGRLVFGQINDTAIVELQVRIRDATYSYPVAAPAYVVRWPAERTGRAEFRFLDAQGREIFARG